MPPTYTKNPNINYLNKSVALSRGDHTPLRFINTCDKSLLPYIKCHIFYFLFFIFSDNTQPLIINFVFLFEIFSHLHFCSSCFSSIMRHSS